MHVLHLRRLRPPCASQLQASDPRKRGGVHLLTVSARSHGRYALVCCCFSYVLGLLVSMCQCVCEADLPGMT